MKKKTSDYGKGKVTPTIERGRENIKKFINMLSTKNIKNLKFYFKQVLKNLYIRLLNNVTIFVFNVLAAFNEIMIIRKEICIITLEIHTYFKIMIKN